VVDAWLVSHATPTATVSGGGGANGNNSATGDTSSPTHGSTQTCSSRGGSGATTPVR